MKRLLMAGVMAVGWAALPLGVSADYQYIISGDPVAAATVDSCAAASSATSLVTSTHSARTAAAPLEARYRTWDESDGIALRSDKYRGLLIIVR